MEVVVTTGTISCVKLRLNHKSLPPTNQHPFLQAGCPSCRPTNSVKALKGKYHIPQTYLPQAHLGVFQLCHWPLIAPGYLRDGCHASRQHSDASTHSFSKNSVSITKLSEPSWDLRTTRHYRHYHIIIIIYLKVTYQKGHKPTELATNKNI